MNLNDNTFVRRAAVALLLMATCVALSGCGNGLSQVSGLVTLDGQPIGAKSDVRVTIQFQPVDGKGATAIALANEDGSYNIATGSQNGILPGDYYVTCSVSTLSANGPAADPKFARSQTSGLKCTVESGKTVFDIPLKSPAKTAPRRKA